MNITKENIEEHIEFVDWEIIPFEFITERIKKKFLTSFLGLEHRIVLEKLLDEINQNVELTKVVDESKYPNIEFFYDYKELVFVLDKETLSFYAYYNDTLDQLLYNISTNENRLKVLWKFFLRELFPEGKKYYTYYSLGLLDKKMKDKIEKYFIDSKIIQPWD